jgi:plastocyanin
LLGVALLVLAVAGFYAAPGLSTHRDLSELQAIVGTNDGFDIGLFAPDGRRVVTLAPGTYTVVVHDRSAIHNFHLASNSDSTVDFRTDIGFVGDKTFTVTFRPNTRYAYACEPHWQVMNGEFRTLSAVGTTTSTPSTPRTPTLRGRVFASGAVSLRPRAVAAGAVRLVVRDRSRRFNFHLAGAGVNRRTSAAFVGTTTWALRLSDGTYRFGSDPRPLRGILRAR